ncbi:MAG: tyrosine-type recombinase/integrase, partial [Nanoarchaeota archaeon]|nr:tyrosine-type recombinase/integrase [Nanoarchaeota archaeon]
MDKKEALQKIETELKLKGFSNLTLKNYSFFISKFLDFSKKNAEELTEDDAKLYLVSLFDTKSKATISLAASSINFFYKILGKDIRKIDLPKKDKSLPEVLSKEEVKKVLDFSETQKSKLMMSLLYSSGLRVSELVRLKKTDLSLNEKMGWVRKGKGAKDRMFSISESLCTELGQYFERHPENIYLFSKDKPLTTRNIQKIIQKISRKAGITK